MRRISFRRACVCDDLAARFARLDVIVACRRQALSLTTARLLSRPTPRSPQQRQTLALIAKKATLWVADPITIEYFTIRRRRSLRSSNEDIIVYNKDSHRCHSTS